MQITLPQRELVAEGQRASKAYSITPGPHILHMLSNLYSDIPWAIVREYGTNMLDAYVKLPPGAPVTPPVIHLPNSLEPYIEFKDFGVGMDWDTIWDVFTTYGASTKRDNNDEVGGLGVGAKVAFCYPGADQWTFESRLDGQRMLFVATRDSQGMPTLLHVDTLPTDEPNGVTVRLPLARDDFSIFKKKVQRFLAYFPMDCTVVGDSTFERETPDYWLSGYGWGARQEAYSASHVIMGNIPYPIERTKLVEAGVSYEMATKLALDIRIPVGDVDLVPSREALQYTERTEARLKQAVTRVIAEIQQQAIKDIEDAETEWDALFRFYENWSIGGLKDSLTNVTWRGKRLDLGEGIRIEGLDLLKQFPDLRLDQVSNPRRSATFKKSSPGHIALHPATKTWVYIDDLSKGTIKRVREHLLEQLTHVNPWNKNRRKADDYGRAYILAAAGLTPDALQDILHGFPVELASDLPAPPKPVRTRTQRTKTPLQRFDVIEQIWEEVDIEAEAGGFYVSLDRGKPLGVQSDAWLAQAVKLAQTFGVLPQREPIYGIPRSHARLEKHPNWVAVVPHIREAAARLVRDTAKILRQHERGKEVLESDTVNLLLRFEPTDFSEGSMVGRLYRDLEALQEESRLAQNVAAFAQHMHISIPEEENAKPIKIAQRLEKFEARYPMFAVAASLLGYQDWRFADLQETFLAYLKK